MENLSTFVRTLGNQFIRGKKVFVGAIGLDGKVLDGGNSSGTSGQVLSTTGSNVQWITVGSSNVEGINDLNDVTITSLASGDLLKYNGSEWVNFTHSFLTTSAELSDLNDVGNLSPSNNDILVYNSGSGLWVADSYPTFTEADTLATVTGRGNTTTNSISVGDITSTKINVPRLEYNGKVTIASTHQPTQGDPTYTFLAFNFGSTDVVTIDEDGYVTGAGFKVSGSSGFLKADGTVDTNTYLTSYTESQDLDDVTDLGASTTNTITVGGVVSPEYSSTADIEIIADTPGNIQPTSGNPVDLISFIWNTTTLGVIDTDSNITLNGFKTPSGTSAGFLKADGSVDTTAYLSSAPQRDLDSLSDVSISNPQADDLIVYDNVSGEWVNSSLSFATTSYVDTAVSNLVSSAPSTLDTLNELAAALGDDANFSTTVTNSIATKLPLAGGTMTGNLLLDDDVRAGFGDDSDLRIYHDATNSYITNATGEIFIKGADDLSIQDTDGTNRAIFQANAQKLYYDGSLKFETTSAGATVSGDLLLEEANTPMLKLLDTTNNLQGRFRVANNYAYLSVDNPDNVASSRLVFEVDGSTPLYLDHQSNATFAGDITFGDSHFIGDDGDDNLLIQGSAGENIIIDSADDIVLDAAANDIRFKVGGVEFGKIRNDSNNLSLYSSIQDENILFKGNDGGTTITALTLDMSDSGAAEFGARLYIPEYIAHVGDSNTLFGFSGNDTFIVNTSGTTALTINSSQNSTFAGQVNITSSGAAHFSITNTNVSGSSQQFLQYVGSNGDYVFRNATDSTSPLVLAKNNNATFAGNITLTPASGHPVFSSGSSKDLNINSGSGNVYFNNTGNTTFAGHITLNGDGKAYKLHTTSYDDWQISVDSNGFIIYNETDARYDLKISGTGNATFGGSLDVGNFTFSGSGIVADAGMTLQTGGGSVNAITLASDGDATFAGDVTINGNVNPETLEFYDINGTVTSRFKIYAWDNELQFTKRNLSTDAYTGALLALDYSDDSATFAGTIQSDDITIVDGTNDVNLYLANTSYGIQLDYSAGDIFFRTNNATRLTIANGGNATFAGNVTIANSKILTLGALMLQDAGSGRIGLNRNTNTGAIHDSNYNAFQIQVNTTGSSGKLEIQGYNGAGAYQSSTFLDTSGNATFAGSVNIGDGSADTRLVIKRVDGNNADDIQFYNGTTRVGEIGTKDTTWLRINQTTAKNIYTPRYIRADGGFFVDSTTKGINGSGNFIGGTITGASDANVSNWDTAYGWGDHASAGYLTGITASQVGSVVGKGQNNNYVASSTSTSNRGNYGQGVWAYSGYSSGSNRPFTYDATLQVMPTSGLGFELSTSWHSTDEGKLKIRALRDCCEGWGSYYDVWTSANFTPTDFLSSDSTDTATGKITFAANYSDANSVAGGQGVTPFKLGFQASNRPGSGNYFTGIEYTFSDTNARAQLGFGSDGNNNIPRLYARTEGWGGNNGWHSWYQIWHSGNDGASSGLDADLLDGQHGSYYAAKDHIRSLGDTAFTNGSSPYITTAQVISEIESDGGFDSYSSVFKTTWSYAGNYNLTDAGRFTETAGTSWLTWTDNSSDSTRGNITALAIAPTTGASAGKVFIYNDQGGSYSPGWREVWTSTSDGAGSGLDADLLDGQQGSYYAPASGGSYVPLSGGAMTGNLHLTDPTTAGTSSKVQFGTSTSWNNNIGIESYWMVFGCNQNEGFKFEDSTGNMLLQLNGANSSSGNGQLSATFAGSVTANGALTVQDSATGILIDSPGHASLRLDRASTSYDNNIMFQTAGDIKFRIWQDGNADYLYIRDDDNAANMVTFKKGGNVGINSGNPTDKFQIDAPHSQLRLRDTDDGTFTQFSSSGGKLAIRQDSTTASHFWMNSSGNVGIGVDPKQKLDVSGNISLGDWTKAGSTYVGLRRLDNGSFGSSGDSGLVIESYNHASPYAGNYSQRVHLRTHLYNGGSHNVLTGYGQNIGIGTSTPAEKLTVSGNANITSKFAVGIANVHASFDFYNQGTAYFNGATTIDDNLSMNGSINFGSSDGYVNLSRGSFITFYENNNAHHGIGSRDAGGNQSDDLRINSYGAVYVNLDSNSNNTSGADFVIGNHGQGAGTINELFRVSGENGKVGVGTTNTDRQLSVQSTESVVARFTNPSNQMLIDLQCDTNAGSNGFRFVENGTFKMAMTYLPNKDGIQFGTNWVSGDDKLFIKENGRVGIATDNPSYPLHVNSSVSNVSIYASADITAFSDARVKDNIMAISNPLDKIKAIRGVTYERTDLESDKRSMGVIAQEVLPHVPEVVHEDEKGMYSVSYQNMVALLIEGMKEQQKEIDELKSMLKK